MTNFILVGLAQILRRGEKRKTLVAVKPSFITEHAPPHWMCRPLILQIWLDIFCCRRRLHMLFEEGRRPPLHVRVIFLNNILYFLN
jgi:hypothetical protein